MQVIFEFVGGPRDGERLIGVVEDPAFTEAGSYYRHTDQARVGARFWCACEYSVSTFRTIPLVEIEQLEMAGYRFRGHVYEIAERIDNNGSLTALARHLFPAE